MISRRNFLGLGLAGVAGVVTARGVGAQTSYGSGAGGGGGEIYTAAVVDQSIYRHPTLGTTSNAPVGVQLCLVGDISDSMTKEEYALQFSAMAVALNSAEFRQAVKYIVAEQAIAACLLDFDDTGKMRIPWVDIRGSEINDYPFSDPMDPLGKTSAAPDDLDRLAGEIMNLPRRSNGGTQILTGLRKGKDMFENCPWRATERKVLDFCGDGVDNNPQVTNSYIMDTTHELALLGVTVNGFAIMDERTTNLEDYFRTVLVTRERMVTAEGLIVDPGSVWAVTKVATAQGNAAGARDQYIEEFIMRMKQKVGVETAGLSGYYNALARLGQTPHASVPLPVSLQGRGPFFGP